MKTRLCMIYADFNGGGIIVEGHMEFDDSDFFPR